MSLPNWVLQEIANASWDLCVTQGYEHLAYADQGMPITEQRTTLAPIAMAKAISALQPAQNDSVLEVGSSVMRLTSLFSSLCCSVFLLEPDNTRYLADVALVEQLELRNVNVTLGEKISENHKFDIIMINSSVASLPEYLLSALNVGGRICYVQNKALMLCELQEAGVATQQICAADLAFLPSVIDTDFKF